MVFVMFSKAKIPALCSSHTSTNLIQDLHLQHLRLLGKFCFKGLIHQTPACLITSVTSTSAFCFAHSFLILHAFGSQEKHIGHVWPSSSLIWAGKLHSKILTIHIIISWHHWANSLALVKIQRELDEHIYKS